MSSLENIFNKVNSFFNDESKTFLWLEANNFNFGGTSPILLIAMGRGDKVDMWIDNALWENEAPSD